MTPLGTVEMKTLADRIAGEIRAELGRRGSNQAALARALGVAPMWVSDRFTGKTELTVNDLDRIAAVLSVGIVDLIPRDRRETTSPYLPQPISRPPNVPNQRRPVSRRPPAGPGRTSRIAA